MDSTREQIAGTDILLRRVPPSSDAFTTVVERPNGGLRTTSNVMSTRDGEEELSCSLRRITSPRQLLEYLREDGMDPLGWYVCQFLAAEVRELGLEVTHTPTESDPGHCSISGESGLAYPKNKAKKLAKRTQIVAVDDYDN